MFISFASLKMSKTIPARDPKQCVCMRSRGSSRKSRDLDALGSREVMVVMKEEIVVMGGWVGE